MSSEVFQHFRVVFQLIDSGQFDPMVLKLDDDTHFLARITTNHILAPTTHAPSRFGRANLISVWTGTFWQP